MNLRTFISEYRWPAGVIGLLSMSIAAHAILVYVATRPTSPRPLPNYYQRAQQWDADAAVRDASRALGWSVTVNVPHGTHFAVTAKRPIDFTLRDREGAPVTGFVGRVRATRIDSKSSGLVSELVELPQDPGHYRTLAVIGSSGRWQIELDASRDGLRFVHSTRILLEVENPEDD